MKLFVGNLSYGTTAEDVTQWFSDIGVVPPINVTIILDRDTKRSRGFGFAEFATRAEGMTAIEAADGAVFDGRTITCNEAKPQENRSGGSDRGGDRRERRERNGNR